jgi:hypothetical protein
VSSKAAKQRAEFLERERKRKRRAELDLAWKCGACGHDVPSWAPICLCGRSRPEHS